MADGASAAAAFASPAEAVEAAGGGDGPARALTVEGLVAKLSERDRDLAALRCPAYYLVYLDVKRAIHDGRLATGDRLPSISRLASIYGVHGTVIRAALDLLLRDRLLSSRSGLAHRVLAAPNRPA